MMRPGRADQHIDAFLQLAALLVVVDAAEYEAQLQAGVRGRAPAHPCGSAPRARVSARRPSARIEVGARLRRRRLGQQRLVQRHQKRRRLAGAGLRLAGDVAALSAPAVSAPGWACKT
jgi:hypothetical protein